MTETTHVWRVAYSTLACPTWSLDRAVAAVTEYGYEGLELRFLDGTTIPPTLSPTARQRVRQTFEDAGVPLVGLGSDVKVADPDPAVPLDMGRQMLDVAADIGAPLLRVYGGRFEGQSRQDAEAQAADTLGRLAPEAERVGVRLGLETHDAFASAEATARVLSWVNHPSVGAIWDWFNCWLAGEPPEVGERLMPWLLHVHMKDGRPTDSGWTPMPLGTGDAPVRDFVASLRKVGYAGWISAEWEKAWHTEIDDAEVALPRERAALVELGV